MDSVRWGILGRAKGVGLEADRAVWPGGGQQLTGRQSFGAGAGSASQGLAVAVSSSMTVMVASLRRNRHVRESFGLCGSVSRSNTGMSVRLTTVPVTRTRFAR